VGSIIALLKQKGGSGSSTLAANIAAQWALNHTPTSLIDCDPQQTLMSWASLGQGEGVLSRIAEAQPERQSLKEFREYLQQRAEGYARVVVDCAPGFHQMAVQAASVANVIVIPVRPSPLDLDSALDALEVAAGGTRGREDACAICLAPSANLPRTRIGKQLPEALELSGRPFGAVVLPSVNARISVAEAATEGKASCEIDNTSECAKEFRAVADALDAIIETLGN